MQISVATGVPLALLLMACANEDAVLGVSRPVTGRPVSLSRDVQPIFSTRCAVAFCHGSPIGAPMSLLSADTLTSLVGADSCEAPSLKRVKAGDSAGSYLLVKLEGTQSSLLSAGLCVSCAIPAGTVNDCGSRMPLGGPPYLTDVQLQLIRDWVDAGASDN